jgi:hypothetical protein
MNQAKGFDVFFLFRTSEIFTSKLNAFLTVLWIRTIFVRIQVQIGILAQQDIFGLKVAFKSFFYGMEVNILLFPSI